MIIILILLLKVFSLFSFFSSGSQGRPFRNGPRTAGRRFEILCSRQPVAMAQRLKRTPFSDIFTQATRQIFTYAHMNTLCICYIMYKKTHVIIMSTNHWIFQRMWCLNLQVGSDGADLLDKLTYYDPRRCRVRSVLQ